MSNRYKDPFVDVGIGNGLRGNIVSLGPQGSAMLDSSRDRCGECGDAGLSGAGATTPGSMGSLDFIGLLRASHNLLPPLRHNVQAFDRVPIGIKPLPLEGYPCFIDEPGSLDDHAANAMCIISDLLLEWFLPSFQNRLVEFLNTVPYKYTKYLCPETNPQVFVGLPPPPAAWDVGENGLTFHSLGVDPDDPGGVPDDLFQQLFDRTRDYLATMPVTLLLTVDGPQAPRCLVWGVRLVEESRLLPSKDTAGNKEFNIAIDALRDAMFAVWRLGFYGLGISFDDGLDVDSWILNHPYRLDWTQTAGPDPVNEGSIVHTVADVAILHDSKPAFSYAGLRPSGFTKPIPFMTTKGQAVRAAREVLRHTILHFQTNALALRDNWRHRWEKDPPNELEWLVGNDNVEVVRTIAPTIRMNEWQAAWTLCELRNDLRQVDIHTGLGEQPYVDPEYVAKTWRWGANYKAKMIVTWPEGMDLRLAHNRGEQGYEAYAESWGAHRHGFLELDCWVSPSAAIPGDQFYPAYAANFAGPLDQVFIYNMMVYFWVGKDPEPHDDNLVPSVSLGHLVLDNWSWESRYILGQNAEGQPVAEPDGTDAGNRPWVKANCIPEEQGGTPIKRLSRSALPFHGKWGVAPNNGSALVSWNYHQMPIQQGGYSFFWYSPPLPIDGWPNSAASPFSWPTSVRSGPGVGYADPNFVPGAGAKGSFGPEVDWPGGPDDGGPGIQAGNCVAECPDPVGPPCDCDSELCIPMCQGMYIWPFELPEEDGTGTGCNDKPAESVILPSFDDVL